MFPDLPGQSGYNKRLRKLGPLMQHLMRHLATATGLIDDDLWVVDSTPIEAGRSKETVKRSDLAGYAEYGYCASHSRFFWGFRLHLVTTVHGLPVSFAITGAKADERTTLLQMLESTPHPVPRRQMTMGDKNYYGTVFENRLTEAIVSQGVV